MACKDKVSSDVGSVGSGQYFSVQYTSVLDMITAFL